MHIWSCDLKCVKLDYAFFFPSGRWESYSVKLQKGILLDPYLPFPHILPILFCHFIFSVYYYVHVFSILYQKKVMYFPSS